MTDFYWDEAKKEKKILKKKSKMADFQNGRFSKSLILGLVGLTDAKGINVAQPIWL